MRPIGPTRQDTKSRNQAPDRLPHYPQSRNGQVALRLALEPAGTVRSRRRRLITVAGTVATAACLLAACGTSPNSPKQPAGGGAGAATPQAAVGNLLSSISLGRYDQVLLDIAPGESNALEYPTTQLLAQLVRLGVVTPATTLSHVPGVSVVFSNPTYHVSSIGDGVDFVQFTGGTVTDTATPSQLPVGPKLQSILSPVIANAHPVPNTSPLAGSPTAGLATVQQKGRWYVSLNYSFAEATRRGDNLPPPTAALRIASAGDSSADAAVKDLLDSAAQLDLTHVIALTPPDEEPALRDYASLFLPKATESIAQLQGVSFKVDTLSLHDETKPDGTLVHLDQLKVSGSIKGTDFTYDNGCVTVATLATIQFCKSNLDNLLAAAHAPEAAMSLVDVFLSLKTDAGIMTVKEDGRWYVSPARTYLDYENAILAAITPQQVDEIISDIQQLALSASHVATQVGL